MSFESTVMAACEGSAALVALVPAARITFNEAHQGAVSPFIVFTRTSTVPQNTTDEGVAGARAQLDNINLQASIYGTTLAQSIAIAAVLRRLIVTTAGLDAYCTGQDETFEQDVNLRGQMLTFSCWYAEDLAPL